MAVQPGVTCVAELRVVVRHAEGVLAEVTDPNARLMFHNALFLGRNDSAFRSLEDLRENQTFNGLTRDDFERAVNDLFVMNQTICRWIETRQTIRFRPERTTPTAVLESTTFNHLGTVAIPLSASVGESWSTRDYATPAKRAVAK